MTIVLPEAMDAGQFERAKGQETLLRPETLDLVAGVGNHETKALLMVYLDQNPFPANLQDMGRGFREFIGDETEWIPKLNQPFNYCASSFEPIGQVISKDLGHNGDPVPSYAISPRGREIGVPLAGLVLQWSLDYPQISLQQILGPTRSSGKIKAAQNRIEILAELVTSEEQGLYVASMVDAEHGDSEYVKKLKDANSTVGALEGHGLVRIERVHEANTREFEIDPDGRLQPRRPVTSPITSAVYDFIQTRAERRQAVFDYEECLEYVVGFLNGSNGFMDEAVIREKLSRLLSSNRKSLPAIKRRDAFNGGGHTKVSLSEEHREGVEELLNTIMAVDDGHEETLERGRRLAGDMAEDSQLRGALMTKAKRFSPSVGKQPLSKTVGEMREILVDSGKIDMEGLIRMYAERHGRNLSSKGMQLVMRELAKDGDVVVERERSKSSARTTRNFYHMNGATAQ